MQTHVTNLWIRIVLLLAKTSLSQDTLLLSIGTIYNTGQLQKGQTTDR